MCNVQYFYFFCLNAYLDDNVDEINLTGKAIQVILHVFLINLISVRKIEGCQNVGFTAYIQLCGLV